MYREYTTTDIHMTYFFDVMSTLIYDPFFSDVPKAYNQSLRGFLADKDKYAWVDFESGTLTEQDFAKRFSADEHHAYLMRDTLFANYRWIDGMKDILFALRAQGHTICTLSNYPIWYEELNTRMELSLYVDQHFVSYQMGFRKPNPKAYSIPLETMNCPPEQAIFIDDREENCSAAQQLGIRSILFHNATQLRAEL